MKTLIIAEKSTQMREYARALGFTLKETITRKAILSFPVQLDTC